MKCPHCLESFHDAWKGTELPDTPRDGTYWYIYTQVCPACGGLIAEWQEHRSGGVSVRSPALPRNATRPLPPEVEPRFARDFAEAVAVSADSPKASAALSRRLLQDVLREQASVNPSTLNDEIQEVLDSNALPSHLGENLDAVRVVGNFAAHPIKSTNTGEVVEVEDGEAEWLLDVLEGLFDFYFVLPFRAAARRAALDVKLAEAGKPPLKS